MAYISLSGGWPAGDDQMTDFEAGLRDRFNRPELLAIWAEMRAALVAKDIPAYKAAGARYRAAKAALGI